MNSFPSFSLSFSRTPSIQMPDILDWPSNILRSFLFPMFYLFFFFFCTLLFGGSSPFYFHNLPFSGFCYHIFNCWTFFLLSEFLLLCSFLILLLCTSFFSLIFLTPLIVLPFRFSSLHSLLCKLLLYTCLFWPLTVKLEDFLKCLLILCDLLISNWETKKLIERSVHVHESSQLWTSKLSDLSIWLGTTQ